MNVVASFSSTEGNRRDFFSDAKRTDAYNSEHCKTLIIVIAIGSVAKPSIPRPFMDPGLESYWKVNLEAPPVEKKSHHP